MIQLLSSGSPHLQNVPLWLPVKTPTRWGSHQENSGRTGDHEGRRCGGPLLKPREVRVTNTNQIVRQISTSHTNWCMTNEVNSLHECSFLMSSF